METRTAQIGRTRFEFKLYPDARKLCVLSSEELNTGGFTQPSMSMLDTTGCKVESLISAFIGG
jgi:hypothetical protein